MRCEIQKQIDYICSLLLIFTLLLFPGISHAKTIHVSHKNGDLISIKEAMKAVSPGDTIEVGPGIYCGNITIKGKGIKIIGKGNPVIQGEKTGTVVTLMGNNIHLKGFTVKGGGKRLAKDDSGVMFRHCEKCVVEDCRFLDNLFGCYFYQSDHCIFRNNLISGRDYDVQEERGNGIHLWDSAYYLIEGNEIRDARDGIYVSFANFGMIKDTWIHHTRYGLHYMYSKNNSFNENILTDNVAGAAVMYSQHMEWNRNIFAHNRGFRAYGVLWQDVRNSECMENLVIDNSIGLYFDQAGYSIVRENMVVWNDIAVILLENSELNTLYGNSFIDNISNVQLRGGTQKGRNNKFYKGKRGNYWDDHKGYDLDNDGIGDNPHVLQNIFQFILVEEPAYRLFLFSPVGQAMVMAEKIFPIIEISHEAVDQYPLMESVEIPNLKILLDRLRKIKGQEKHSWKSGRLGLLLFSLLFTGLSLFVFIKYHKGSDRV